MRAGTAVGISAALLSDFLMILLVWTVRNVEHSVKSTIAIAAEILMVPACWFGGFWAGDKLLQYANMKEFTQHYIYSLLLVAAPLLVFLILLFLVRMGFGRGRSEVATNA